MGARLLVFPVSPSGLGGRLALFALQFEQHRIVSARLVYEPVVPATQAGALAMYYSNDIGTSMLTMGRDHVAQAATQPSFVQFQVWDEASLDIDPGDANLRYYNDESGDYRSQIQGFACVLAPDTLADNITYGNLYIEYDVEFYSARMTQTISPIPVGTITGTLQTSGTSNKGAPWIWGTEVAAGWVSYTDTLSIGNRDLTEYVVIGTILGMSVGGGNSFPDLTTPHDDTRINLVKGMTIFGRATINNGNADYSLFWYVSMADAAAAVANDPTYADGNGELIYDNDHTGVAGVSTIVVDCRLWHAPDITN